MNPINEFKRMLNENKDLPELDNLSQADRIKIHKAIFKEFLTLFSDAVTMKNLTPEGRFKAVADIVATMPTQDAVQFFTLNMAINTILIGAEFVRKGKERELLREFKDSIDEAEVMTMAGFPEEKRIVTPDSTIQ